MTTETKSAFARRHGVNRSTVNKWEARGHLVMTVDGLVNVEGSEKRLTMRPVTYRGGQAKGPQAASFKRLSPHAASTDSLLVEEALCRVVREIGQRVAARAVEFGASLKVAYALNIAACLEAGEIGEMILAEAGAPFSGTTSLVERAETLVTPASDPDWHALAALAGEPLDLDGIEDWFSRLPYPNTLIGAAHV